MRKRARVRRDNAHSLLGQRSLNPLDVEIHHRELVVAHRLPGDRPRVEVQQVWLRRYPLGSLAAQLFGTVGRMTAAETHQRRYRGVSHNDVVWPRKR